MAVQQYGRCKLLSDVKILLALTSLICRKFTLQNIWKTAVNQSEKNILEQ